jgi:hypothetical protein
MIWHVNIQFEFDFIVRQGYHRCPSKVKPCCSFKSAEWSYNALPFPFEKTSCATGAALVHHNKPKHPQYPDPPVSRTLIRHPRQWFRLGNSGVSWRQVDPPPE